MRAALTHPASKLSNTSLRLDVFVCYVLVVKKIIFKTNFLFWIFLVVVYGFIYSHEREQIQDTKNQAFYQRGKGETFKGENVVVYWWWMQGNGAWKQKVEAMPTCYCLTFTCCQPCLPIFQGYQKFVSWTQVCTFSCYVSHAVVSGT